MIRRDIQQDGDVRFEIVHVVELEGREFNDIVVMILMRHLQRQRIADVPCQTDIQTRLLQDIENQRSSGGLSIRTGDADHLCMRVTRRELNLGDDRCALCLQFLNERCGQRNTRRFDNLVGIENQLLRMLAVLPFNAVLVQ